MLTRNGAKALTKVEISPGYWKEYEGECRKAEEADGVGCIAEGCAPL